MGSVFRAEGARWSGTVAMPRKYTNLIHIRIQQRNGRKSITTVQGLSDELDLKKILKALKKEYNTNGTILADGEMGDVIQMQGGQRKNAATFLAEQGIAKKENIKVHGF